MSAEETKHDLPPGYDLVRISRAGDDFEWWGVERGGRMQGRFGMDTSAVRWAWEDFPISRDEYKAMQRDRRAMNLLRAVTLNSESIFVREQAYQAPQWTFFNSKYDFPGGVGASDPAEAIIAALGESS
jgi:hypothetical protein